MDVAPIDARVRVNVGRKGKNNGREEEIKGAFNPPPNRYKTDATKSQFISEGILKAPLLKAAPLWALMPLWASYGAAQRGEENAE